MIDSAKLFWLDENESWSDQIQNACEHYKKTHIVYPNLMFASTKTDDYVNQQANKELENVFMVDVNGFQYGAVDIDDTDEDAGPLTHLDFNDFLIRLCLDESFPYMAFEVDFIENPTFDGEEIPDETEQAI